MGGTHQFSILHPKLILFLYSSAYTEDFLLPLELIKYLLPCDDDHILFALGFYIVPLIYFHVCVDKSNTLSYTIRINTNIAGIVVEWDVNKNSINKKKHGISFETAALVFADEERIEYYDKLHSLDEDRYVVIGCVQGILYVVYTMRNEAARIISARMATLTERKIYYGE